MLMRATLFHKSVTTNIFWKIFRVILMNKEICRKDDIQIYFEQCVTEMLVRATVFHKTVAIHFPWKTLKIILVNK